jgi:hypothetical protein
MFDPEDYADSLMVQDDGEDQYNTTNAYEEYALWDDDYLEDSFDPTLP